MARNEDLPGPSEETRLQEFDRRIGEQLGEKGGPVLVVSVRVGARMVKERCEERKKR